MFDSKAVVAHSSIEFRSLHSEEIAQAKITK